MRRFLLTVVILVIAIVVIVLVLAWLSGDGGVLPFRYDGFG